MKWFALHLAVIGLLSCTMPAHAELRAGAAVVDVTPTELPVLVNGGFLSRSANSVKTPLHARALVLDDGSEALAIVVVDSCMMPRELLDEVKKRAAGETQIATDRMLIAATHTHSAPACMGCLGTNGDPSYIPLLERMLVEAIVRARENLEPAQVGWASVDAGEFTASRRWIRRPDLVAVDPFGNRTVRANMHPSGGLDEVIGPSGPEDPELCMISVQSTEGRAIALLASFSMHYFSDEPLSADYYGLFCEGIQARLGAGNPQQTPPMVAMMAHGCSGDIWRRDYARGAAGDPASNIETYAQRLVDLAAEACQQIEYTREAPLGMAETRLTLRYRVPDRQRLEWAQRIADAMGDRLPENQTEVYAREQLILHERQTAEVVVQALRIGSMAIATTPTETYALTGLKIKLQSPWPQTMVLDLANGGEGYIPPPEQHVLGGYNTWPARTAGLEVTAEPKIAETAISLLEQLAGKPRRAFRQARGPACEALLAAQPVAYWRLDEFQGPRAVDASGNHRDGFYEPGVVFFLEGPHASRFAREGEVNRAAHFAGGRLAARLESLGDTYTVSLWFWNGMPLEARPVAGWLYSRGRNYGLGSGSEHLGLAGGPDHGGKLIFLSGNQAPTEYHVGRSAVKRWTWNHVVLVRAGDRVRVYLNGDPEPEIDIEAKVPSGAAAIAEWYFGGRSDHDSGWEGRLDEIAVFDRALTADEIARLVP